MAWWNDLIFRGNKERRNRVIISYQRLFECIKNNIDTSNEFIEFINEYCHEYLHTYMMHAHADAKKSVKYNIDELSMGIYRIQSILEIICDKVKEVLGSDLYETLYDPACTVQGMSEILNGYDSLLLGAVIVSRLSSIRIISTEILNKTNSIVWSKTVSVTAPFPTFDPISGVIVGGVESIHLQTSVTDVENILQDYEPISKEYTKVVHRFIGNVDEAVQTIQKITVAKEQQQRRRRIHSSQGHSIMKSVVTGFVISATLILLFYISSEYNLIPEYILDFV